MVPEGLLHILNSISLSSSSIPVGRYDLPLPRNWEIIRHNGAYILCVKPASPSTIGLESYPNKNHVPLLVDLVLETVFQYLDFDALKAVREVCKKWEEIAFSKVRKKSTTHLDSKSPRDATRFRDVFSKAFEAGREFNNFHIRYPSDLDAPAMGKWMDQYGHYIHHLTLTDESKAIAQSGNSVDELREYIAKRQEYGVTSSSLTSILCRWCPNLKTLDIPIPQILHPESSTVIPTLLPPTRSLQLDSLRLGCRKDKVVLVDLELIAEQVFQHCRGIKSITLTRDTLPVYSYLDGDGQLTHSYEPVYLFVHMYESLSSLESLDLSNYTMSRRCLFHLNKLRLDNLKSVSLSSLAEGGDDMEEDQDVECLNIFLEKVGPQLNALKLVGDSAYFRVFLGGVRETGSGVGGVDSLSRLPVPISALKWFTSVQTITHLTVDLSRWTTKTLDFLHNLDHLQSLVLLCPDSADNFKQMMKLFMVNEPVELSDKKLESLVELELRFRHCVFAPMLVPCFPNVRRLTMFLSNDIFTSAYLNFPSFSGLSHLTTLSLVVHKPVPDCWEGGTALATFAQFAESYRNLKHLDISVQVEKVDLNLPHREKVSLNQNVVPIFDDIAKAPTLCSLSLTNFKIDKCVYNHLQSMARDTRVTVKVHYCDLVTIESIN